MAPEVDRGPAPYQQIAKDIEGRIRSGQYAEGDTIPSARGIVAEWGVAQATAQKVLTLLQNQGLVRSVPGIGTVVHLGDGLGGRDRLIRASVGGKIYREGEVATITAAESLPAPAHVAAALGIDDAALCVRRVRTTRRDGVPVSCSTSWYAGTLADQAPDLLKLERIKQGTFAYVAAQTGNVVTGGREDVEAASADADTAAALEVDEGSPVLHGRTWFTTETGDVIEYGESYSVQGRVTSHTFSLG